MRLLCTDRLACAAAGATSPSVGYPAVSPPPPPFRRRPPPPSPPTPSAWRAPPRRKRWTRPRAVDDGGRAGKGWGQGQGKAAGVAAGRTPRPLRQRLPYPRARGGGRIGRAHRRGRRRAGVCMPSKWRRLLRAGSATHWKHLQDRHSGRRLVRTVPAKTAPAAPTDPRKQPCQATTDRHWGPLWGYIPTRRRRSGRSPTPQGGAACRFVFGCRTPRGTATCSQRAAPRGTHPSWSTGGGGPAARREVPPAARRPPRVWSQRCAGGGGGQVPRLGNPAQL